MDHQVADLVFISSIRGTPRELVDFLVWEECLSDDQILCCAESTVVHATTLSLFHGSVMICVVTSHFCI